MEGKTCIYCKEFKPYSEFHKLRSRKDGHQCKCKQCRKERESEKNRLRVAKWREDNPDGMKKWREENIEHEKQYRKEYRKRPEYEEMSKKWWSDFYKRRKKEKPHLLVWRRTLTACLSRMGREKEGHTIDELGYSAEDLKTHLESLFTEGMSWDNCGDWHVDHIEPVCSFHPDTPMCEVNALSNLQPLWAEDNIKKSQEDRQKKWRE